MKQAEPSLESTKPHEECGLWEPLALGHHRGAHPGWVFPG